MMGRVESSTNPAMVECAREQIEDMRRRARASSSATGMEGGGENQRTPPSDLGLDELTAELSAGTSPRPPPSPLLSLSFFAHPR